MDANEKQAREVYATMVAALNERDWKFEERADELKIISNCRGDDLLIDFTITIVPKQEIVYFISTLPFRMSEEKRVDGAVAVCKANYGMYNGSFDYDSRDGEIRFRLTTSYCGCVVGKPFFMDMIATAVNTVDRYNDRFLMLSKGLMTLAQFIEQDK